MNTPTVYLDKVSYHFGQRQVLDAVDLSVPAHSIYGFLGANGAGKTTTLRILLGLLKSQSGAIRLFGDDLHIHRTKILARTGSLIEQPSLYLHLTGRENLEIHRRAFGCPRHRIKEILSQVGLTGSENIRTKNYSLGMKQRLGIGLAILHDPDLLILDEPINGLDPGGIIEMRNLFLHLNSQYGKTILISSHLLPEIEKIATHIGIINQGKLLFQGSLADLHRSRAGKLNIEVNVGNAEDARKVLLSYLPAVIVTGRNTLQIPCEKKEQVARINSLLVSSGIPIYHIKIMEDDLESMFVQLTKI